MLECAHRPLKPGEQPKRRGQQTVFEATGALNPTARALWDDADALRNFILRRITIKHDGQCSKLLRDGDELRVFRRLDVRRGNTPPLGSMPASPPSASTRMPVHLEAMPLAAAAPAIADDGGGTVGADGDDVQFYWVRCDQSQEAADQYYLSALLREPESGRLTHVRVCQPSRTASSGYEIVAIPTAAIVDGTYELIGPKVQGNRYALPAAPKVSVMVVKKGDFKELQVEPHCFIRHGEFAIELPQPFAPSLDSLRNFVVAHAIEGLVIYFSWPGGGVLYKINRGHIGVELQPEETLRIALPALAAF